MTRLNVNPIICYMRVRFLAIEHQKPQVRAQPQYLQQSLEYLSFAICFIQDCHYSSKNRLLRNWIHHVLRYLDK